jgi:hypothetical protein
MMLLVNNTIMFVVDTSSSSWFALFSVFSSSNISLGDAYVVFSKLMSCAVCICPALTDKGLCIFYCIWWKSIALINLENACEYFATKSLLVVRQVPPLVFIRCFKVFLCLSSILQSYIKCSEDWVASLQRERESLSAFIFCPESECITITDNFGLRDVRFYLSEYLVFLCCYLNSLSWEISVLPEQNNSWVGILAYGHFTTTLNIHPQFLPWLLV